MENMVGLGEAFHCGVLEASGAEHSVFMFRFVCVCPDNTLSGL